MDSRLLRIAHAVPRHCDVFLIRPGQRGDRWALHLAGHCLHTLKVTGRRDRETGLDDIHPKARELVRDLHLLPQIEVNARRLLPVAEGRVEKYDALGVVSAGIVGRQGSFLLARVD